MGDVVSMDLAGSRQTACRCGNVWFDLAVVFEDGRIAAQSTTMVCRACGVVSEVPR